MNDQSISDILRYISENSVSGVVVKVRCDGRVVRRVRCSRVVRRLMGRVCDAREKFMKTDLAMRYNGSSL